ncbi:hypothetical protein JTB14_034572, partial [Gonioctena quinquepunctata]
YLSYLGSSNSSSPVEGNTAFEFLVNDSFGSKKLGATKRVIISIMMNYEAEQKRLLRLFEEVPSDDDIEMDSQDSDEEDNEEVKFEESDTEQDASSDSDKENTLAFTRQR